MAISARDSLPERNGCETERKMVMEEKYSQKLRKKLSMEQAD